MLGECLLAWARGGLDDDRLDAKVAADVVGEVLIRVRLALMPKK